MRLLFSPLLSPPASAFQSYANQGAPRLPVHHGSVAAFEFALGRVERALGEAGWGGYKKREDCKCNLSERDDAILRLPLPCTQGRGLG